MSVLRRKLTRDLWHYRSQIASVALVMAAGIALFVALRSMKGYSLDSRDHYYREQRFADVFVSLRRAPLSVADRVAAIPGVTAVESRIVADVLLDVPGATEVVTGHFVSVPDRQQSMLNGLVIQRGSYPSPVRRDEIVVSRALRGSPRCRRRHGRGHQRSPAKISHRRPGNLARVRLRNPRRCSTCSPTIAASASIEDRR